jgi:hypothetical protein
MHMHGGASALFVPFLERAPGSQRLRLELGLEMQGHNGAVCRLLFLCMRISESGIAGRGNNVISPVIAISGISDKRSFNFFQQGTLLTAHFCFHYVFAAPSAPSWSEKGELRSLYAPLVSTSTVPRTGQEIEGWGER